MQASSRWIFWRTVGLNWFVLVSWSLWRIPIPAVNEPHYLGKARHWWDPSWCPGDFFLDSANPHLVFYATFGAFAHFFSLYRAAVLGRVTGLLVLAAGWQRLSQGVTGKAWSGLVALPVFLMLQVLGNLSGEWLVGGIEAKVPAYGLLFWAIGSWLERQPLQAAFAAGLSVSLHPLVGLWGLVAGAMAQIYRGRAGSGSQLPTGVSNDSPAKPGFRMFAVVPIIFLAASLPGLIPATFLLSGGSAQSEKVANQLQVASRLSHHLDPMQFPKEAYRYWSCLIALWLLLEIRQPQTGRSRWWNTFVACSILIALSGVVIGWGPRPITSMPGYEWRMRLLKFYFFRLGDLMVPVALSLVTASSLIDVFSQKQEFSFRARVAAAAGLIVAGLLAVGVHFPDENPGRMSASQLADWSAANIWIRDHSPPVSVVYVTDSGWAPKWFAERPEYVSYKDMPQDSASIIEWNRRLWVIARWRMAAVGDNRVTHEELAELRRQTGIEYLICRRFGEIEDAPIHSNQTFRVYQLPAD